MGKRIGTGLAAALWLAAAGAYGGEAANPILDKFADAITFYINFDEEGGAPAMAAGRADVLLKEKTPRSAPGFLGQGLTGGGYRYHSEKNLDLSRPGAIVLWMALRDKENEERGKEGYSTPVRIMTDRGVILFGRQPGPFIRFYVAAPKGPDGKTAIEGKRDFHHRIHAGGFKDWGERWHMVVLTWDAGQAGLSVDGGAPVEKPLPEPLDGGAQWFSVGMTEDAMDELAILNRKLTAEEIKALYEETMALAETGQ